MAISFFIDAEPVGMPRLTQTRAKGGKRVALPLTKMNPLTRRWEPHPVIAFKSLVQMRARQAYQGAPLAGPVRVEMVFLFARPKRLKAGGRVMAPVKPDVDNLEKAIFDPLNKLLWNDDSQIVEVVATKFYAASDELPGVQVVVVELT
jgi:Holliday junction resolvase RusA-like endonuclease